MTFMDDQKYITMADREVVSCDTCPPSIMAIIHHLNINGRRDKIEALRNDPKYKSYFRE